MYFSVVRRLRLRRVPVGAHEGSAADWLRRHEAEAAEAAESDGPTRDAFRAELFGHIIDTRNLLRAAEEVASRDTAAGADGLWPRDLDCRARVELARVLARLLRDGSYRPGPVQKVEIPKLSGGYRTLSVPTVIDRVVQTAVLQAVQPYLDPQFRPTTLGGRPGMSTAHALVVAGHLAAVGHRWVVVAADVRKAFDVVPHDRLLAVVRERLGNTRVTELITTIVRAGGTGGVGIGQGSPLSPLLLNVYLDAVLDRPWAEAFPDVPLIRWVDDVLLLCRTRQEAESSLRELTRMLAEAKMPVKADPPPVTSDLGTGESVVWLGYELHVRDGRMEASIPGKAWEGLRLNLRDAHRADHPMVHAQRVILSWVDYLGPCFETSDVDAAYNRITEVAANEGIGDIPDAEEVRKRWENASDRYQEGRELFDTVVSAHHHDGEDRGSYAPCAAPPAHKRASTVPTAGEVVNPPSSQPANPMAMESVSTESPSPAHHTSRGADAAAPDRGRPAQTRPRQAPGPRRPPDDGRCAPPRTDDDPAPLPHRRSGAGRPGPHGRPEPTAGPGSARPPPGPPRAAPGG
jgi:group II intron reverse transcriptase/maturase